MTNRDFVRHTVATLAYRAKAIRGAPDSFTDFRAAGFGNLALGIVAPMADLYIVDWALTPIKGKPTISPRIRWRLN